MRNAALLAAAFWAGAVSASAAVLTGVNRGIHPGFELLVVSCDQSPRFRLAYDRVAGEVLVQGDFTSVSEHARRALVDLKPGVVSRGAEWDAEAGQVVLKTRGAVFIREYVVSGPDALLLDLSPAPDTAATLPFEMSRDEYLLKGGIAERRGDLELALRYLETVRRRGDADPALVHRAGVLQHQLGRWEAALETFAHTAAVPELAADAHARRAMIYLDRGDTAAAGRTWAEYFHRGTEVALSPIEKPPAAETAPPVQPAAADAGTRYSTMVDSQMGVQTFMGWGLLAAGAAGLVMLLMRRSPAYPMELASVGETGDAEPPPPKYTFTLPDFPAPPSPPSRRRAAEPPPPPKPAPSGRIPAQRVLELARAGANEAVIARELNLSRDEVAMVLNLARLAQEARTYHRRN